MPLTHEQLLKYMRLDSSLEAELKLNESSRTISADLMDALVNTILPVVSDKNKKYLFTTLWTVISKEENQMVGDICFAGEPNSAGEIEIGYGTHEKFRNRGFMTEAVGGIIKWLSVQSTIKSILADTERFNIASFRILEKNNFIKIGETDTLLKWKLNLNQ
jgi:predicted acetyltransferase